MKIYHFSVAGDTNWTEAFTSKADAIKARNAVVREYKDDTRYVIGELVVEEFPISAKGVLEAYVTGAAQAPN